jgi:hypothetical protein
VALDAPLNQRQLDVLRWIHDGCPEGRWSDFTYKTTAGALQGRRLVDVSKRGGTWSATVLPAGVFYLAHGGYPPGHWSRRRVVVDLDSETPAAVKGATQTPTWTPPPPRRRQQPPADGLTPTRKLLKSIIDAGGRLEIDTRDDDTSYRSLVGIINRRAMAPDGQEVIMLEGQTYHHLLLRLSSVSDWQSTPPADVVAAERIARWHPAVATLRAEKRFDSVDKLLRGRVFRLLHALAKEAETRGHTVRLPRRNQHGYIEDQTKLHGNLIVNVNGIDCSVSISQPQDRTPHNPTAAELERQRRNSWDRPPRYDYVPSDRLNLTIDTASRWSSKVSWRETKSLPLESRLPDVMTTFERWAVVHVERTEAERLALIAQRERELRQDELARNAFVQHKLGERFVADMQAWELAARLRQYLDHLRERAASITDDAERRAADEWLHWCERYAAEHDPATNPLAMPTVRPPNYTELAEFRNRLGFSRF